MEDKNPEIEPPEQYDWIWDWFWELSAVRRHGPNGPDPISFQDMAVWSQLTGNQLLREEVGVLRRMDAAFLSALNDEYRDQREREKRK